MPAYYSSEDFTVALRANFQTAFVHEVGVGDFTGDGKADFVLSYFLFPLEDRATPIRLFAGNGAGGFTDITAQAFPNGGVRRNDPTQRRGPSPFAIGMHRKAWRASTHSGRRGFPPVTLPAERLRTLGAPTA